MSKMRREADVVTNCMIIFCVSIENIMFAHTQFAAD
jgi:hypothetical protein